MPVFPKDDHESVENPIHTWGFTAASYEPMSLLSIENGHAYIIVIIDCFTRWVELYASPAANAKEAMKAILDYIKTLGQPHQLLSDNGGQYANEIVAALC